MCSYCSCSCQGRWPGLADYPGRTRATWKRPLGPQLAPEGLGSLLLRVWYLNHMVPALPGGLVRNAESQAHRIRSANEQSIFSSWRSTALGHLSKGNIQWAYREGAGRG